MVNPEWWNGLPSDVRSAIQAAADKAVQRSLHKTDGVPAEHIKVLNDKGMQAIALSKAQEKVMADAMQPAVKKALAALKRAAAPDGLPGAHHFYITFKTEAPGVSGPNDLLTVVKSESSIIEHPVRPSQLQVTAVTPTSVSLSWYSTSWWFPTIGYDVFLDGVKVAFVTDKQATLTGLSPDTQHRVKVTTKDSYGFSSPKSQGLVFVWMSTDPRFDGEPDEAPPTFPGVVGGATDQMHPAHSHADADADAGGSTWGGRAPSPRSGAGASTSM